ncbi:uncharacterized protein LOC141696463 [Apium graveolens]|uniref:uncharacterized protein LOC141696463 n=1 Tax=Apium graveolens TaxID=4045 RepID=UPI003D797E0A
MGYGSLICENIVMRDVALVAGLAVNLINVTHLKIRVSRVELNTNLERWRASFEAPGLRLSRSKTEYLWANFNEENQEEDIYVYIAADYIPQTDSFKYLGSIIKNNDDILADFTYRIKAGWVTWKATTIILCDKSVPLKLKGKFYRLAVKPTLLYGSECCPLRKVEERRLENAELRILR